VTIVVRFRDGTGPEDVPLSSQILALAQRYKYTAEIRDPTAIRLRRDPNMAPPAWTSEQLLVMKHVGHPRLNVQARPAEDIDPLRVYHGPLSRTMAALRAAGEHVRIAGGLTSTTSPPEVFDAASRLGEAFLTLGPEYTEKFRPAERPRVALEPSRRRLFKRASMPPPPSSPQVRIWWAYGGGMRDGGVKWPGWALVDGQVKGPGAAHNVMDFGPLRELLPLEVGLSLLADEPSGDISWYCAQDPERVWQSIRFGGIDDGDLLARAMRAARFVIDEIAPA
jgi:hypothetical protein